MYEYKFPVVVFHDTWVSMRIRKTTFTMASSDKPTNSTKREKKAAASSFHDTSRQRFEPC